MLKSTRTVGLSQRSKFRIVFKLQNFSVLCSSFTQFIIIVKQRDNRKKIPVYNIMNAVNLHHVIKVINETSVISF